jgi:hypothetical protein
MRKQCFSNQQDCQDPSLAPLGSPPMGPIPQLHTAINQSKSDMGHPTAHLGSLLHTKAVLRSRSFSGCDALSSLDHREPSNHPLEVPPLWLSLSMDDSQLHHAEQPRGVIHDWPQPRFGLHHSQDAPTPFPLYQVLYQVPPQQTQTGSKSIPPSLQPSCDTCPPLRIYS